MTYKIKKQRRMNVSDLYEDLDNEAYLEYGSRYGDLDKKSKNEIAKKVIEG